MNELKVTEYGNFRVLTTQQLADSYGTDTKTISNNFNRNKDRYVEGKHYIYLEGDDLKNFKGNHQIDDNLKFAPALYLWTEKGTFLHAKSLNTDVAWEVYDRLMETYFKVQEAKIAISELSPELQMFNQIFQSVAQQQIEQKRQAEQINRIEQKQAEIEQKQDVIVETFQNNNDIEDFQVWAKNCLSRIAESGNYRMDLFRNERHRAVTTESYVRLVKKTNCRLELLVANAKARALQNNPGIKKSELDKINKLYVIAHDKKLKIAYELVIKEMMVCYCVSME